MVKIQLQIKLITYFGYALIGLFACLMVSALIGGFTLLQHQIWVEHTNSVLKQVEIAEQFYQSADYAGRNRVISGLNPANLVEKREKAIAEISKIREIVSDNPEQMDTLNSLEADMRRRFENQDTQAETTVKNDTTIQYNLDLISKSVQFTESVDHLFSKIKIHELNLLQLERLPRLTFYQWGLMVFTIILLIVLVGIIITLIVFHRRLLRRLLFLGEKFDDFIHKTETDSEMERELIEFKKFIDNETDTLPKTLSEA